MVLRLLAAAVGLFAALLADRRAAPVGALVDPRAALILFITYFQVEVQVAINDWYGPFYDMIQVALGGIRAR